MKTTTQRMDELLDQLVCLDFRTSMDIDKAKRLIRKTIRETAKAERQRIADKVKSLKIDQITDHKTLYNAILEG